MFQRAGSALIGHYGDLLAYRTAASTPQMLRSCSTHTRVWFFYHVRDPPPQRTPLPPGLTWMTDGIDDDVVVVDDGVGGGEDDDDVVFVVVDDGAGDEDGVDDDV